MTQRIKTRWINRYKIAITLFALLAQEISLQPLDAAEQHTVDDYIGRT